MQQAYEMAVEALGLTLTSRKEAKEDIPKPSEVDKIKAEDGAIVIVEFRTKYIKTVYNTLTTKM